MKHLDRGRKIFASWIQKLTHDCQYVLRSLGVFIKQKLLASLQKKKTSFDVEKIAVRVMSAFAENA